MTITDVTNAELADRITRTTDMLRKSNQSLKPPIENSPLGDAISRLMQMALNERIAEYDEAARRLRAAAIPHTCVNCGYTDKQYSPDVAKVS